MSVTKSLIYTGCRGSLSALVVYRAGTIHVMTVAGGYLMYISGPACNLSATPARSVGGLLLICVLHGLLAWPYGLGRSGPLLLVVACAYCSSILRCHSSIYLLSACIMLAVLHPCFICWQFFLGSTEPWFLCHCAQTGQQPLLCVLVCGITVTLSVASLLSRAPLMILVFDLWVLAFAP
jgi:hypothetical protein